MTAVGDVLAALPLPASSLPQRRDLALVDQAVTEAKDALGGTSSRLVDGAHTMAHQEALDNLAAWERIQNLVEAAFLARA